MVHDIHIPNSLRCTEIGGICGSFPSPEARRDEGLNLPGPVVLGYIRPGAWPKNQGKIHEKLYIGGVPIETPIDSGFSSHV